MAHCSDPTHTERRPNIRGAGTVCVVCTQASARRRSKRNYDKLKAQVYERYGGKCVCCGETEPLFLAIDHVNDDGAEHRRTMATRGMANIYRFIVKAGYPDTFQILCHNCNFAKRVGPCPHMLTAAEFAALL